MPNSTVNDDVLWQELIQIAKEIDNWADKQRKTYLYEVTQREFSEGKTWRRQMIKLLIVNPEKRKEFLELAKSGLLGNIMSPGK
jgi:hypothetical protein